MLRYAPNVSWLFSELPFASRPKAAADLGFDAIEFGFPSHADLASLEAARKALGLVIVLFNQDVPLWDAANRGYLSDPRRRQEFRRTLDQALEIARRLDALKIQLPSGVVAADLRRATQIDCMLENLRAAAPLAAEANVQLTIEVLNPVDNPGYFLTSSREALDIVRQVDHPNVRLQLDTYHLHCLEGCLLETVDACRGWIGHLQFADAPGRHEPGSGVIDFAAVERAAEQAGYRGYVGLEYAPRALSAQALAWVPAERRARGWPGSAPAAPGGIA